MTTLPKLSEMLQIKQAAAAVGVNAETLSNWYRKDTGPPYYKVGRRRYYDPDDLKEWIEGRRRRPEP